MVHRIYTEIKNSYAIKSISDEIFVKTGIETAPVKLYEIIEISGDISRATLNLIKKTLVSEVSEDKEFNKPKYTTEKILTVMYISGRSDAKSEEIKDIIRLYEPFSDVSVRIGEELTFSEEISDSDIEKISEALINPFTKTADRQVKGFRKSQSEYRDETEIVHGFNSADYNGLLKYKNELMLDMDIEDMVRVQNYFLSESREPTVSEMRIADTFFSEKIRHTTFKTVLAEVNCEDSAVNEAWEHYKSVTKSDKYSLSDGPPWGLRSKQG
jgi:phosphoribosylformylglycinamidine synthase